MTSESLNILLNEDPQMIVSYYEYLKAVRGQLSPDQILYLKAANRRVNEGM